MIRTHSLNCAHRHFSVPGIKVELLYWNGQMGQWHLARAVSSHRLDESMEATVSNKPSEDASQRSV